jgi:hypothetical protein
MLSRTLFLATVAFGALLAVAPAQSQNKPADQGFDPGTGQINRGSAHEVPSTRPSAPIPSREDIRAALMMSDPGTISTGEQSSANNAAQPETTGKGLTSGEGPGPIGSTMQTKPAKFSHRNDVIDHTPIMGMPILLDAQHRQQIFQAVISDKASASGEALDLKPADALPYSLIVKMQPLPASIGDMQGLNKLDYVKGKDKIYLVTAQTAIVVDVLDGK